MKLSTLLQDLPLKEVVGNIERDIARIDFDSRRVTGDSLFVAVRGSRVDGHDYLPQVVAAGAKVLVVETLPAERGEDLTWIVVENSARALGLLSAAFYGHPSRDLKLVGVTGTNGKTTVATLLYQLFSGLGYRVGLLSTVENRIGEEVVTAAYTTPDAVSINELLARMRDAGCDYVFTEVSSHALDQERVAGLQFAGAIFTNITHDHLDYHGTFQAYIKAKKKFFDLLPTHAFALINIDDKRGEVMVQNTRANVYRYSLRGMADFRARILDNSPLGLHLDLDGHEVHARMLGSFNAYNLLAVYGAARLLEQTADELLPVLSLLKGAEGRFEYVMAPERQVTAIVDYAHTPDSLEKILTTIQDFRQSGSRIITVVGCGGDRDRTKRPIMAQVAARLSDELILTSDNPRTEDPEAILNDMEAGLEETDWARALRITARRAAIQTACRLARAGDIILVAGKGHEKYQEIQGVRHPFDDKAVVSEALGIQG